jgi:hypothetical protein
MMSFLPEQTLIVEDSPYGLLAASRSKSHVLRVKSPTEVSYSNIIKKINEIKMGNMLTTPKWKNEKLNILIPMAGAGSRFEQAGYTYPGIDKEWYSKYTQTKSGWDCLTKTEQNLFL